MADDTMQPTRALIYLSGILV